MQAALPVAVIRYDIPKFSLVTLTVYDLYGWLVETLLEKKINTRKSYKWVLNKAFSGVYILRLRGR
ncbi:uncharacterized protein METZ01_LOCUS251593, partial [marine metagenome]